MDLIKKLQKRPTRRELIIFIICALAVGYLILDSFYFEMHTQWSELHNTFATKKAVLEKLTEADKNLKTRTLKPMSVNSSYYYENMSSYTFTHGYDFLLKFITSPRILGPLQLISINAREDHFEENYFSKEIVIVLTGSFVDCSNFVTKLESVPILFIIDMIEIGKGGEDFGKVEATIRGTLHGIKKI